MEVYRGDIFYIQKNGSTCGSEMFAERPGIIVSNDIGNTHSNIVEVVYLTAQKKKLLPTHVSIMCKVPSTAMCEQIVTVSSDRLGTYVRTCTAEEMEALDKALKISLGLNTDPDPAATIENALIDDLRMKLEGAERTLDDKNVLLENTQQQLKDAKEYINKIKTFNEQTNSSTQQELIKLKTESDLYRKLYEETIERLITSKNAPNVPIYRYEQR